MPPRRCHCGGNLETPEVVCRDVLVKYKQEADGQPDYSVAYRGRVVVTPSQLGLRFRDRYPLDSALKIASTQTRTSDETWEQPWGERRLVRDNFHELTVNLVSTQGPDRRFSLVFRALGGDVLVHDALANPTTATSRSPTN